MEEVVLVDTSDNEIGVMEKMEAHRKGLLHRAFSVLIYNSKGEMLLQKRAKDKYHSGGLWSNACCSHPRPGESMQQAVERKLMQEMGIDITVDYSHKFIYRADFGGLIEHECDHIYTGKYDGAPVTNPHEVEGWKYMKLAEIRMDMTQHPQSYSYWFKLIMEQKEVEIINH